ncbi:MAG: LysM peptidoglycan-binding domain-containing protein [Candidatus Atribacteria bacterium]|nr:LysM peptidoglycan-binding domain-containing protein [Candidatus Atribacteria bacterium]
MSKNLIVLFIIILLIVGGFGIYTYDQSNQAKKEVEEKYFELESKDELILELKENIQEKEKQIEELKASLTREEKDLEKEYVDKLSELTEEKAKLEVLLAEKEETIKTIEKQKEESEQIVILKDELVLELKENIQEKEKQIDELKVNLAKGEKDLEKEYTDKLSELTEEKVKLEVLLTEKEETIKTIEKQKEESEQIVILKDELVLELKENIQEKEKQIDELKASLAKEEKDLEKEYATKVSELMEEKGQLEALLIEQEGISQTKDREKEELISKLENCNNQINELKDKLVQQEIGEEKDYVVELSALREEKSKLENQLKTSQGLLSEKESTITVLNQQNEESEKSIMEKDKTIAEISESMKEYENLVKEIREQMAQEGKEKEAEYADRLALLKEGKDIIEAKLAEAIKKTIPDYYEVKKGDSLWKIAERFYNAGEKWIRIFEANVEKINNPDLIYPYQRFTIPKE